jgi:hypothetical protein
MTVLNTIRAAIRERRQLLIRFNDSGVVRTDATEPYLLGFDRFDRLRLLGFYWASDPGPSYKSGRRDYDVDRITEVELLETRFVHPQDRFAANAFDQFKAIRSSIYFPNGAWPAYWGLK